MTALEILGALVDFLALVVLAAILQKKPVSAILRGIRGANTTKLLVWCCLGNGIAWVWCSYLLAYLGRDEIAESLSKVAITEIIAVILVYALKSLTENLSRHNSWPDKPAKKNTQQDCD